MSTPLLRGSSLAAAAFFQVEGRCGDPVEVSWGFFGMDTPTKNPVPPVRPSGPFEAAVSRAEGSLKLQVSYKGTDLGFVGVNEDGYCVIVDSNPLEFTKYVKDNTLYLETQWNGDTYYLSISHKAYVGLYSWRGASGWSLDNNKLTSQYNGQDLSYYGTDDGYLYAWDAYSVLKVTQE